MTQVQIEDFGRPNRWLSRTMRKLLRVKPIHAPEEPGPLDGAPPGHSKILMKNSVSTTEGDFVAGEWYWVLNELADVWIIRGYAVGDLSREYTEDDRRLILAGVQIIRFGEGGQSHEEQTYYGHR